MKQYEVVITANLATTWQADSEAEALAMAQEWTEEEYGNLIHKADFNVEEVK